METTKVPMSRMATVAMDYWCKGLEASSSTHANMSNTDSKYTVNSFITSALDSWSNHYPFRFKPEHIWLLILQAVAIHVDQNAEKLRAKYVNHKGKMTLTVRRDDFVMGSDKNDWEGVIEEFVDQIDANTVKDTATLFDCDFSKSSLMDKICTKVTIMDICKSYFNVRFMTLCGFPQITLDGHRADWVRLKQKTSLLLSTKVDKQFGTEWAKALIPLLDRFIDAFDGNIDCLFWNSMIKRGAQSERIYKAESYYTGWFNILFPFTKHSRRNVYCVPYSMDRAYVEQALTLSRCVDKGQEAGGKVDDYPSGLATAPVTWGYQGEEMKMAFIAGFVGHQQDPKSLEICPNLEWMLAHGEILSISRRRASTKIKDTEKASTKTMDEEDDELAAELAELEAVME